MSKSNALENSVLDHILGGPDYTRLATVYVALYNTDPTDADTGTEVTGTSYARVAVTNNATNWPAASGGSKSNGTAITFPTAGGTWTQANYFGIRSASSGGVLLYSGALTTAKTATSGDTISFAVGALTITED